MSAAIRTSPSLKKSSICLSPSPSMSKALREQKCFRPSTACARRRGGRCSGARRRPRRSSRRSRAAPPSRRPGRQSPWRLGKTNASASFGRFSSDHLEDLRNDVAGALDYHRVADARVEPRDLVLVVQAGVGDDDAADGDRLEFGHRRQRAGAADLDLDRLDDRRRAFGGEFVRHRPARARETKPSRSCSARSSTL